MALPQLQLAKGHSGQVAWAGAPQCGLDEDQVGGPAVQEMDQVVESAVAGPGVVLQPCRRQKARSGPRYPDPQARPSVPSVRRGELLSPEWAELASRPGSCLDNRMTIHLILILQDGITSP